MGGDNNKNKMSKTGQGKYDAETVLKLRGIGILSFVMGLICTIPTLWNTLIYATSSPIDIFGNLINIVAFMVFFAVPIGVLFAIITIVRLIHLRSLTGSLPCNKYLVLSGIGIIMCSWTFFYLLAMVILCW